MSFTYSWVETDPDGSIITVSQLDDYERLTKSAVRERLEGDPANPNSGIYDSGSFGTAATVRAGTARAYAVTTANLGTITLQDGRLAFATDTNKLYHMRASGYVEIPYMSSAGGTVTGAMTIQTTTTPQVTVGYDGSHSYTISVASNGNVTLNATGTLTITPNTTISGTLTVSGASGSINGSSILTAANYNTYAPSLTGGSASGTWGINVTGNAGTATSATTSTLLTAGDDRTAHPSDLAASRLQFFFGSWNNNNTTPYADNLMMRSYSDSSGGQDTMLSVRKDGTLGLRVWTQTYGSSSAFATSKDCCWTDGTNASGTWGISISGSCAGNAGTVTNGVYTTTIGSYAPTLTGGGASGTWGINITGNAGGTSLNITQYTINQSVGSGNTPTFAGINLSGAIQYLDGTTANTTAPAIFINTGDCIEFGHTNSAGYRGSIGTNSSDGKNWVILHGQKGTTANTFRTRGVAGTVIISDLSGGVQILTLSSNADNQSGTQIAKVDSSGNFTCGGTITVSGASGTINGNTIIHAGNYNSYAPTLTGGGASGTWGINITGNASGTSSNITAYTINQNVGSTDSPTFAGLSLANASVASTLTSKQITLAPSGTQNLLTGLTSSSMATVIVTNKVGTCVFQVTTNATVSVVAQAGSNYSATAGGSTYNLYGTGGTTVTLQNSGGGSATFSVLILQ